MCDCTQKTIIHEPGKIIVIEEIALIIYSHGHLMYPLSWSCLIPRVSKNLQVRKF